MSILKYIKAKPKLIGVLLLALIVLLIIIAYLRTREIETAPIVSPPDMSDHPIYSKYEFGETDNIIDFGIQPLGVPLGVRT